MFSFDFEFPAFLLMKSSKEITWHSSFCSANKIILVSLFKHCCKQLSQIVVIMPSMEEHATLALRNCYCQKFMIMTYVKAELYRLSMSSKSSIHVSTLPNGIMPLMASIYLYVSVYSF